MRHSPTRRCCEMQDFHAVCKGAHFRHLVNRPTLIAFRRRHVLCPSNQSRRADFKPTAVNEKLFVGFLCFRPIWTYGDGSRNHQALYRALHCHMHKAFKSFTALKRRRLGKHHIFYGGRAIMNLVIWLPAMFLLGVAAMGLCYAFLIACDNI